MEQIVFGFANINFEQLNTLQDPTKQNNSPLAAFCCTPEKENCEKWKILCENMTSASNAEINKSSETEGELDECNEQQEELDNVDASDNSEAESTGSLSQRRLLPRRASKESSLLKIKRRTIVKPTKRINRALEFSKLRPAEIQRIYTKQSLTSFRPSNLETIFEEPSASDNDIEDIGLTIDTSQVRLVGAKKLKRSISCCDGINVNKTLLKKRRAKVQKTFGRRFALKKIPLNDFLERLNKSIEDASQETTNAEENSAAAAAVATALELKHDSMETDAMDHSA